MEIKKKNVIIILLAVLFIVLLLSSYFIVRHFTVSKMSEEAQSTTSEDFSNDPNNGETAFTEYINPEFAYSFRYPTYWWISNVSISDDSALGTMSIEIESSETDFRMGIDSQFLTGIPETPSVDCEETKTCGGGDNTTPDYLYNPYDFEEFVELDGVTLYISKEGSFAGNTIGDEFYAQPVSITELSGNLARVRDGKISENLHLFGLSDTNEGFFVYCSFGSEEAAEEYWPEYKEIFRTFAASIRPVE